MLIFGNKRCKDRVFARNIAKITGFKAKKLELYALALTHKSAENTRCPSDYADNERLEFLGDAVLDAVVSELLYLRYPSADEGFLTQMRTKIVNGKSLSVLAEKIGLHKLILLSPTLSPPNVKIKEDAFEAFIGAIYLDKGYKFVKRFVLQKIFIHYINLSELQHVENNYKSRVIEWSQKHKIPVKFQTEAESLDSYYFISYIRINDKTIGKGKAKSKKAAEQIASKLAYLKIKENEAEFIR